MFGIVRVLYTVTKYQEENFKSRFVTPTQHGPVYQIICVRITCGSHKHAAF